uniref:Uncharacterized protein n=1 Tax=viral metagenome TaxID=1070528 RepID=A0A6C0DAE0_9ZZZZ
MLLLYFLFSFFYYTTSIIKPKIIRTPLYRSIPLIKMHDMVILENPELNNVFVVDFSPVEDISKPYVLFRMFTGNNIKGKLRVFYVEKKNIINELGKTQKLHDLNEIKNYNMDIYNIINNWNTSFNVYNHNCKDFSKYLIKSFNLLKI